MMSIHSKSAAHTWLPSLRRVFFTIALAALLPVAGLSPQGLSQSTASPAPDILILANGDQLTGKLLSEANGTVTFHSDMAGDLTFSWDKIKSIRTSQKFAVIQQGQHISRKTPDSEVAQGTVAIQDAEVQVETPGGTKNIPQKDAQYMVDEASYSGEVHRNPSWGYGWSGSLSAGAADVEATTNSRSFTGGAAFVRVGWIRAIAPARTLPPPMDRFRRRAAQRPRRTFCTPTPSMIGSYHRVFIYWSTPRSITTTPRG
jgi:hypothetical protein